MITVLLADDQFVTRYVLEHVCAAEPDMNVVGIAKTGDEALALALQTRPDVAVLDIKMPGLSGLEVTSRLSRRLPDTRVIVLTALDSYGFASRAIEAGAKAFLKKHSITREIVPAIRKVYRGGDYLDPVLAQCVALKSIRQERSPVERLSARELNVLMAMLRGESTAAISEALCLSAKTIERHRRSIRQKLNVSNDAQLGVVAARYGLDPVADDLECVECEL